MKTKIQWYAIKQVKIAREANGLSQRGLTDLLMVSASFIQQVEDKNKNCAYNLNHLNTIAHELKCSLKEFVPTDPFDPEDELVQE